MKIFYLWKIGDVLENHDKQICWYNVDLVGYLLPFIVWRKMMVLLDISILENTFVDCMALLF